MNPALQVSFDHNNHRVRKARLGRRMNKSGSKFILYSIIVITLLLGAFLLYEQVKLGAAICFSIGVWVFMFAAWCSGELSNLPAKFDPTSGNLLLHEALDGRLLARLGKDGSPWGIWSSLSGMKRQQFFRLRYGLENEYFDKNLSKQASDGDRVWQIAAELAKNEHQKKITATSTTVALLTTIPGYEEYLAQLHLEPMDLIVGIDWHRHIEEVMAGLKDRHSFGGIASDWTAGFTPLLSRLGTNITADVRAGGYLHRDLEFHRQTVDQVLQFMAGGGRPNAALVGDVGVGKTTTVYSFAKRLLVDNSVPKSLKYHQVVELKAATILAQISDQQSLENLLLHLLDEARKAKNIILFFDEAQLFFNQGPGAVDVSNVLYPILERSDIRMILAMSQNQWQAIAANNQALAGVINYIAMPEPDEQNTMRIMEDQILLIEWRHKVMFMYQALQEGYRLADRYLHDMAFPGKAIKVLEMSVNKSFQGLVTEQSVQQALEGSLGVKIQTATGQDREALMNLEGEIHKRMINQTRAVQVVSDALRRARSGVNNPRRPIGTFLFLGPTGVGKTELSKALAEVYFSGADRIVRIDMNEFLRPEDVGRLLEPGVQSGTSLVAQIRKQPFSVVLFDEIEKAHPDVVNVLLQLLDEGVLRDSTNREVSFRDAIVIATSNAGAERIRQLIDAGHSLESFEDAFVSELIESGKFKPEFLNRFDEIVLFRPLKPEELLQVVDIMMAGINQTLVRQKVQVTLTPEAKQWLVAHGYDARLGARPLRRMVQRSVENIVAKKLLSNDFRPGSTLQLDATDLEQNMPKNLDESPAPPPTTQQPQPGQ